MTDRAAAASEAVGAAVTRMARRDGGRVVAVLAGRFRDLDLAEEAVQDGLEEAVRTWPDRGVPANPGGWLLTVARRKAIDRLRRAESARRRTLAAAPEVLLENTPVGDEEMTPMTADDAGVRDDQLRLILLCCHPALAPTAQTALTLRLVGGLTTAEIAAAYLVPEATLAQRIVRAKRKIAAARIPLTIPAALDERVGTALRVLYLIFNEGYLSHSPTTPPIRTELVDEAIRLTGLLVDLVPEDGEAKGLLALELFHRARMAGRVDPAGDLVLLADQDRTRWDLAAIATANRVLADAVAAPGTGPLRLQAMIAGAHANARTSADTDWTMITSLYGVLSSLDPSPVVALNHAVAVGLSDGPHLGLARLHEVSGLDRYHLFHAARGELLLESGDPAAAAAAFGHARALAQHPGEQRHLDRRLEATRLAWAEAGHRRPDAANRSDMTTQNFDDDPPVEDTAGDMNDPDEYGSLSVEDDPAGTTDPSELAGTADESDADVH